jgi:hypothetical protein
MCVICASEQVQASLKKDLNGLWSLDCSGCCILTNIPQIDNLRIFYCYNCPLLTNISPIIGLESLHCYNCPLLTNIPQFNSLKILCCSDCPLFVNHQYTADLWSATSFLLQLSSFCKPSIYHRSMVYNHLIIHNVLI